jgi:hypothetical protein
VKHTLVHLGIGGGGPARLHVNLRRGSITGAVLAPSRAVNIPAGYKGVVHFGFDTDVSLTRLRRSSFIARFIPCRERAFSRVFRAQCRDGHQPLFG